MYTCVFVLLCIGNWSLLFIFCISALFEKIILYSCTMHSLAISFETFVYSNFCYFIIRRRFLCHNISKNAKQVEICVAIVSKCVAFCYAIQANLYLTICSNTNVETTAVKNSTRTKHSISNNNNWRGKGNNANKLTITKQCNNTCRM